MQLSRVPNQAASNRSIVVNADNPNDLVFLNSLEITGLTRNIIRVQRMHCLTNPIGNFAIHQHFIFFREQFRRLK